MGGVGTVSGFGGAGSAYNNPAMLALVLPGMNSTNITALQQAMQIPVDLASQGLANLSNQSKSIQTEISAWQTIQNDLGSLLGAAQALESDSSSSVYGQIAPSSSNSTNVSVASNGQTGEAGTYVIGPAQGQSSIILAQNEIVNSTSQSSATSALNLSGSFSINGVSVSINANDNLQSIAQAINKAGVGVTAAVMDPPGGGFVLSLQGQQAGPLTFSDPNGILQSLGVLSSSGTANVVQASQYAEYSVNGVQITQGTSNTDASSIPGVTFTLNNTAGATVTVTQNTQGVQSAVQSLTSAFNQVLADVNRYAGKGGVLEGNGTLLSIMQGVEGTFGAMVSGAPNGYNSVPQIGLSLTAPVDNPGNLSASLDTTTFNTAISANPAAVQNLLGGSSGIATQLANLLNGYVGPGGTLGTKVSNLQQQVTTIQSEINDPNSPENQAIAFAQQQAQQEFTAMVQALSAQQTAQGTIQGLLSALNLGGRQSSGGGSGG